jgi:hypothetical protein
MKVAILNYEGLVPASVTGPFDVLDKVSSVARSMNVPARTTFEVDIVNSSSLISSTHFNVIGNKTLKNHSQHDMVIIQALYSPEL